MPKSLYNKFEDVRFDEVILGSVFNYKGKQFQKIDTVIGKAKDGTSINKHGFMLGKKKYNVQGDGMANFPAEEIVTTTPAAIQASAKEKYGYKPISFSSETLDPKKKVA